jgi:hypothetical protein
MMSKTKHALRYVESRTYLRMWSLGGTLVHT